MSKLPTKTIEEVVDKNTGEKSFQIRIDIRSQKVPGLRLQRRETGYKTRAEADKSWAKFYQECLRELLEKESKGQSLAALVEAHEIAYRRGELLEPVALTTMEDRVAILRDWAEDFWNKPAKEVTPYDVHLAMRKIRETGRSWARANNFKSALNRVYKWGITTGFLNGITQSPAFGISLKREKVKKQLVLTEEESKKLLQQSQEMNHPWYRVWAMALLTGLRNGELFSLQWTDVDFEKKLLSITKSYSCRLKTIKSTKSGNWRTVPINDDLERLLIELRVLTGDQVYVLPRLGGWARSNQSATIKKFCKSLGLPLITFHDLRASFATNLLRKGVPAIQVMKICGWEDLETMEHYVRLAGIDIKGATDTLKILPEPEIMEKVVRISDYRK